MPPQTMRQFLKPPEKAPDTLPRTQSTMSLLDYFSTVIQGLADPTGWTEPKAEDFDNPHAYTQALKAHGVGQLLGMAAPLAAPLAVMTRGARTEEAAQTLRGFHGSSQDLENVSQRILQESNGKLSVLDLRRKPSGDIELETIATAPGQHGQGAGTEAMRKLTDWADQSGVRLILSPSEKGYQPVEGAAKTTSTSRLKGFYSRFGFVDPTSARHYDPTLSSPTRPVMYRTPKPAAAEAPQTLKAFHGSPPQKGVE